MTQPLTKSDLPLVSIVIPAFNASVYIVGTIHSALNQIYPNLEVVVIDDGSTDGTGKVIRQVFGSDTRVGYYYQSNAGVSAARNYGIQVATGEFVHFLDADDILLPDKIQRSYELFCQYPQIAVVYGAATPVEADGVTEIPFETPPLPSGDVFCEWLTGTMANGTYGTTPTFMVRRDALLAVGGFAEDMTVAEDWDLWLRLAADHPFAALNEPLVRYRRADDGGLHANRVNMARGRLQVIQRIGDHPRRQECLDDDDYRALLAGRWHVLALRHWENSQRKDTRQAFKQAIDMQPERAALRRLYWLLSYVFPASVVRLVEGGRRLFK